MKNTKTLLALIICFSASCSDMELVKPISLEPTPGDRSSSFPGTRGSFTVQTTSLSTLQSATGNVIKALQRPPGKNLVTKDGLTYGQLNNVTGSAAFHYLNNIRILAPSPIANFPHDAVRADIASNLKSV